MLTAKDDELLGVSDAWFGATALQDLKLLAECCDLKEEVSPGGGGESNSGEQGDDVGEHLSL